MFLKFTLIDLVPERIRIYFNHIAFKNARQQYVDEQEVKGSKKAE